MRPAKPGEKYYILDTDMAYFDGYRPSIAIKLRLRKLAGHMAESVRFQPNVAEPDRKLGISWDSIYHYLKYPEKALLINTFHAKDKDASLLQKPEKIYLKNTNLSYALRFIAILAASGKGDFYANDYTIEVGSKDKSNKQLAEIDKAYIAADNILTGEANKIPLCLSLLKLQINATYRHPYQLLSCLP